MEYTNFCQHLEKLKIKAKYDTRFINGRDSHKLPNRELLLVEAHADTVFPDVLSFPFFLTTEKVLDVIRMYGPDTVAKQLVLLDGVHGKSETYFMPILKSVDCFHADTERNGDGKTFKRLVLARGKLRDEAIFRPEGASHTVAVVRLDLAESILRRGARGIGLTPVETKECLQGESKMGFDGLTERNRQAHGAPAIALAAPFAGNPPTGGLFAGAAMEQSDGFNVAGKKGALLKGEEHSEFDAFDDAPKAGAYSPRRSILKAVVGVATGLFVGGSAAVTCLTVSDLANGRNSSWGTYAAKTLAGAVTGAVMGGFAGSLGPGWFASKLLTHAGPFGALYGIAFRTTDGLVGEAAGLDGYKDRDFWEKVWEIYNPANVALDYGLAAALAGLVVRTGSGASQPAKPRAGARELAPAEAGARSKPQGNASAPSGKVPQTVSEGAEKITVARAELPKSMFTTEKLQHEFKHAPDFGVNGNWNKTTEVTYQNAVQNHINNSTDVLKSTYRGQDVYVYVNKNTGLGAYTDLSGGYIGGWKFSLEQMNFHFTNGISIK